MQENYVLSCRIPSRFADRFRDFAERMNERRLPLLLREGNRKDSFGKEDRQTAGAPGGIMRGAKVMLQIPFTP